MMPSNGSRFALDLPNCFGLLTTVRGSNEKPPAGEEEDVGTLEGTENIRLVRL